MEAIQQLDSKEYKGNRLQVSTSHRETKEQIGRKNNPQKTDLISPSNDDKRELYVRNIDDSLDENSIKLAFEKVVTIEQVRIVKQRKVCKLYVIANMLVFLISGPYFLQFAVRIIKEIWFCHRRVSQWRQKADNGNEWEDAGIKTASYFFCALKLSKMIL